VDLVVFDCDGVLVDSERLTVDVEARVLTELGWPHTADDVVARYLGRSSEYQLGVIADRLGEAAARHFDAVTTREVHAAFAARLAPVAGVVRLLDHLRDTGVPTCVASSGTHTRIAHTLGLTGLADRFTGRVFSAEEVGRGKPAPDLFLHAADRMASAPERCLVIEDSVPGVVAGVAAGMRVVGYGGGLTPPHLLAGAGAVLVTNPADLVDVLPVRAGGRDT
jgi:HAD superfamily hydrolase (TIGR01509 family)